MKMASFGSGLPPPGPPVPAAPMSPPATFTSTSIRPSPARPVSGPAMPLGRVIALIGAMALLAAYAMPWFSVSVGNGQGITLSGLFLGRFLAGADDLRRFMPGARGGPAEVQQLRLLVLL